jgi:hypothetical protein
MCCLAMAATQMACVHIILCLLLIADLAHLIVVRVQDALLVSNWPLLMDAASNSIGPAADWFFYAFKLLTFYYIQVHKSAVN